MTEKYLSSGVEDVIRQVYYKKELIKMCSIKKLIKTAFTAVGKVMYIYGGGWNENDNGAGIEAMSQGISDKWINFSKNSTKNYDYRNYDHKVNKEITHYGLDCSGYIGWVISNLFNDSRSYVEKSYKIGSFLEKLDFGKVIDHNDLNDYRAGDIMFGKDKNVCHVYICLGRCSDGSILILHSSPCGVQLNGSFAPNGNECSQAVCLAEKYMKKYFSEWYNKFPDVKKDTSYLTDYNCFRWEILSDNENYSKLSPEKILIDIFSE